MKIQLIIFYCLIFLTGCSGFLPYYLGIKNTSVAIVDGDKQIDLPQVSPWLEELLCLSSDKKTFWTAGRSTNNSKNYSLYNYDLSGKLINEFPLPLETPELFKSRIITLENGKTVRRDPKGSFSLRYSAYFDPETETLYFTRHHGFSGEKCENDYNSIESIAVWHVRNGKYEVFPYSLWGIGSIELCAISADKRFLLVEQKFDTYGDFYTKK